MLNGKKIYNENSMHRCRNNFFVWICNVLLLLLIIIFSKKSIKHAANSLLNVHY